MGAGEISGRNAKPKADGERKREKSQTVQDFKSIRYLRQRKINTLHYSVDGATQHSQGPTRTSTFILSTTYQLHHSLTSPPFSSSLHNQDKEIQDLSIPFLLHRRMLTASLWLLSHRLIGAWSHAAPGGPRADRRLFTDLTLPPQIEEYTSVQPPKIQISMTIRHVFLQSMLHRIIEQKH